MLIDFQQLLVVITKIHLHSKKNIESYIYQCLLYYTILFFSLKTFNIKKKSRICYAMSLILMGQLYI